MSLYPLSIGPCHRTCTCLTCLLWIFTILKSAWKVREATTKDFINPVFLSPTKRFSFNSFISRVDAREFVAILSGSCSQLLRRPVVTFATKPSFSVVTPVGPKQLGPTACSPLPPSPRLNCEAALPSCEETEKRRPGKVPQCNCPLAVYNQLEPKWNLHFANHLFLPDFYHRFTEPLIFNLFLEEHFQCCNNQGPPHPASLTPQLFHVS